MKLLLVEDHFLVSQAMGLHLAEAGHEIVGIAADAHEAVELAGNMLPDLALVDVQLACGTSGIYAAREMLAQHNVRSLFVTSDYDAAWAAKDAAVGCVRKPYSGSELIAAIQAAENCLKINKLTPYSLRLEFCEGSLALLRHTLERMQENQHVRLHRECTPTKRKILMALDSLYRVTE